MTMMVGRGSNNNFKFMVEDKGFDFWSVLVIGMVNELLDLDVVVMID